MLGTGIQPNEHAKVSSPHDVVCPDAPKGLRIRVAGDEPTDELVSSVLAAIEVRLHRCIRARGASRWRRREKLEDAQGSFAVREGVMPGVPSKEDTLASFDALNLAGLGVRDRHHALEDVKQLVSAENRPMIRTVTERAVGSQPEYQGMDQPARNIDPVRHLPGLWVSPHMTSRRLLRDQCWLVEGRTRRRAVQAVRLPLRFATQWRGTGLTRQSHKVIIT